MFLTRVKDTPRSTLPKRACRTVVNCPWPAVVESSRSVTVTSLFGSAPGSALPLTVEVDAQRVTVPSRLAFPVRLRRPSVAGAHGPPVAGLVPVGYPGTV